MKRQTHLTMVSMGNGVQFWRQCHQLLMRTISSRSIGLHKSLPAWLSTTLSSALLLSLLSFCCRWEKHQRRGRKAQQQNCNNNTVLICADHNNDDHQNDDDCDQAAWLSDVCRFQSTDATYSALWICFSLMDLIRFGWRLSIFSTTILVVVGYVCHCSHKQRRCFILNMYKKCLLCFSFVKWYFQQQ